MVWAVEEKKNPYPRDNWKQQDKEVYWDAALRHLTERCEGTVFDHESGLRTIAHAGACVLIALWLELKENDGKSV